MNRESYERLTELVNISQLIGFSLILGDKIQLTTYTQQGKIDEIHKYEYDDPKCIQNIEHHIEKQAQYLRHQWGSQFLEFAAAAFSAQHRVEISNYTADIYAFVDADGKPIFTPKGHFLEITTGKEETANPTEHEERLMLRCPFGSHGLQQMSEYFTHLFLGETADTLEGGDKKVANGATVEEEDEKMTISLNDQKVVAAIVTMWYSLTDEQQQQFMDNHKNDGRMEVIREAKKRAAQD